MALAKGTRLGPYEVQAAIGSGGMGEVYRARDTRLSRDVAIKILPSTFSTDPDRRLRFEREARAVASLSHPNIVSLFDTGVHDGQLFAVMELLEGETLRQRLGEGALPARKVIDYGVQIARGLGAAHEKGLIHRDLKPENVFLLRDGQVKILDFGLARGSMTNGSGETGTAAVTDPGTVMGTVGYMSPEQVRGQDVDARSDLFSFGAVLYEMVGGQRAFRRQTAAETMTAILKDDPPELAGSRPDLSPALDRIVRHCLEKSPSERFQSARDVAFAIEALSGPDTSRSGAQPAAPPPQTRSLVVVLPAILLLAAAVAYWLYQSGRIREDPQLTISRMTFTGSAFSGAISPDGKYVAYVQDDNGEQSLWLSQRAISNHRQLLPPAGDIVPRSVTFSPDGQFVYFVRGEGPHTTLFQLPFTGGEPRRVRDGVHSSISFSPDGKHFAFLRGLLTETKRRDLVIATTDGAEDRVLSTRRLPGGFGDAGPAWSPDGRIITVVITSPGGLSVLGVRVTDGSEEPILSEGRLGLVRHLTWLPGGEALIAMATPRRGEPPGMWRVMFPGDSATKLTDDLTVYEDGLSVAADGTAVTGVRQRIYNIWIGEDTTAKRLTAGSNREDGVSGLTWTPDGKILYRSNAGGHPGLWMMNADGSENRQLDLPAAAAQPRDPAASPDGRYLVWAAFQGDDVNIWRMNRDSTNPIPLTKGASADSTQVSADSRFVVYAGWNPARDYYTLWKVSIDGGEPTQLLDSPGRFPVILPDGKLVAFAFTRPEGPNRNRYGLVPVEGGAVKPIAGTPGPPISIVWSPNGRALANARTANGVTNLWSVPLDGSPTRQLTRFTEMTIQRFAWSKDGKLAVSRGTSTSDIVLIKNLSR